MIPLNRNLNDLKRSGIRRFTNLARETPGCVMLTIGEPDLDTPEAVKTAAMAAIEANQTHYAPNQGTEPLRRAIAQWETRRGLSCTPSQVLVTVGACEALFTALFGVLNPGDEVIVPTPAFPLYESIATIAGAKTVALDTSSHGFQLTEAALRAAITPNTKAIVLNSPNNPTGVVYTEESLAAVKAVVKGKPIYIICDNVYSALSCVPCPDLSLDPELREQVLLCQSFSKPYAMTGWRVGYLIGPEAVVSQLLLLHAAAVTAIPTFIQTACIQALSCDTAPMARLYEERRSYLCGRLRQMGLSFPEPEGAFYVFVDISRFGMDSETFCTRMITEGGVAAVPGSCFGADGYIRLSYCYSLQDLQTALDRMERFLHTL